MARDRGLEELIRADLPPDAYAEKGMFGGWAWILNGNLLCCARSDGMLARLGKERDAWALALPGVTRMMSGERPMVGWVRAGPDAYGDDALRRKLLAGALAFVRGLPAK